MLFRNRTLVRGTACFFLLEILASIFAPSVSWAMMGPGQPEFTSYEGAGSPDMVNLTTGDLTYNIPALDIPGPERGFSLPLTYRAGIKLEQEASWVGLGWSLNAGAISRSLNGYPDDAAGEVSQNTYNQDITRGWHGGVPGVLELNWDVNTGHSGSASFLGLVGLGWSGGHVSSGDLVGVHMDSKGVTVDPVGVACAAVTIATLGTAGPVMAVAAEAAKQIGTDVAVGVAMSVLLGKASNAGGALGEPTVKEDKGLFHTDYWVFYNDQRTEFMYGSLYFDQMSKRTKSSNASPYVFQGTSAGAGVQSPEFNTSAVSNDGGTFQSSPAADLSQYNGGGSSYWSSNSKPVNIAHDDFSVMGGNISGNIRPYRLEVGSLAFPYKGLDKHNKFAAIPYLDDYKVPFRYENSISNGYDYHEFTPSPATTTDYSGLIGQECAYPNSGIVVLKDPRLFSNNQGNAARTAPARKGIVNRATSDPTARERKFVQGKNIKWFNNADILAMYNTSADGPGDGSFLEATHPTAVWAPGPDVPTGEYTTCPDQPYDPYSQEPPCQPEPIYGPGPDQLLNNPWRVTLPGRGIGAFAITSEDGTTYHYSLPVYHYTQFSKSHQLTVPAGAQTAGVSTQTMGPRQPMAGGYATTWLLTAITSSDYVDRGGDNGNGNGAVDATDWGGWVRFDYGKFSSAYKWRQPYLGESYSEDSFNDASFAEGSKETYYLNSISTRTHTALFLKSLRKDGRGHFQPGVPSNLGLNESLAASSLRLDEIVLLNNEDWAKLQVENGIRLPTDNGPAVPAFSANTSLNNLQFDGNELNPYDTYQKVYDKHDVEADARIRTFLNQRALKRVAFNFSYRLCDHAPNSFDAISPAPSMTESQFVCNRTGKLTLESVSIFGPANTKLMPDFKFAYGSNPDYRKDNWDGFGMYKSGVTLNTNLAPKASHQVSTDFVTASTDGAAWSLTEITNPLGGRTRIKYERDQYAKVSEYDLQSVVLSNTDGSNVFTTNVANAADFLRVGQVITVGYNYSYTCQYPSNTDDHGEPCPNSNCYTSSTSNCPVSVNLPIIALSGNSVTFDPANIPSSSDASCGPPANLPPDTYCSNPTFDGAEGIIVMPGNKNGGDLRVAAISTLDETGKENQVLYRYSNSLPPGANSTGVISKEPAFVNRQPHPFDELFDYPGTSVLYGKVTVFRGAFRGNNLTDYDVREEYAFQTPYSGMIRSSYNYGWGIIAQSDGSDPHNAKGKGFRQLDTHSNSTVVDVGAIGQPLFIKKFNRQGELEANTAFEYGNSLVNIDNIAGQGVFTEGVMTNELLGDVYYRVNRSTKKYVPTVLLSTTTKSNGLSSKAQQEKFDFYTGTALESSFSNYLGELYRSKIVPAYSLANYAEMGPASETSTNKNMLAQEAASYTYKVRANGTQSLVGANIQTWNGTWSSYRGYDTTADAYTEHADDPRSIWRLHESYVWSSPRLNADGTYSDADYTPFNWSQMPLSNQATGWLKAGEFTRYDHYSKPLESKDVNGQYFTSKMGYGDSRRLVTGTNAKYTEVAYSGAEDAISRGTSITHFGGEVRDGGKQNSTYSHTGLYSTKLMASESGFTYKASLGSEVRGGRKYRLSCWVHSSDLAKSGQLYARVDGADMGTASIASANTKRAGDWYLLNLLVDLPNSGQLTVGCRNSGSQPVYVDDFRFHPVTSPTMAYVYDPHTAQVTYVLDNENLYTRFEYDAAGKMVKTYKEVLTPIGATNLNGERIVREYAYNYARMPEPNWIPTGQVSWQQTTAGPTDRRQHEEKDINPLSPTYNTTRTIQDGSFPACAPACSGPNQVLRNGVCVTRTRECMGSIVQNGCNTVRNRCFYTNTYRYRYSDGTYSTPYDVTEGFPCRQ